MGYGRVVMGILFLMDVHQICGMDQKPMVIVQNQQNMGLSSSDSSSSLSQSPGATGRPYMNAALGGICEYAASSLKSFTETVNNKLSDEAAFKKLGWPRSDTKAEAELQTCINNYEFFEKLISNLEYSSTEYSNLESYINRRREYLKRVMVALPTFINSIEFATHCLEFHLRIMHGFEEKFFRTFLTKRQQAVQLSTLKLIELKKDS
jgi:hypothetical protein